jgi:ribonucleoside-diphosphate reductase alpha chain
VRNPFSRSAAMDFHALEKHAALAVRFLDNVTDLSRFPLPEQQAQAHATRRIGLGVTGLGDALIMLGLHYDSDVARHTAVQMLASIRNAAYRQSCALAVEKAPFPALDREAYLQAPGIRVLPDTIRDAIARHGIRNSHLLAIAPAGTISVLANNVSSGIEPVFALQGQRRVLDTEGNPQPHDCVDHAYAVWQRHHRGPLPDYFVTAAELTPRAHLDMLAALQTMVDNAISKTINVPEDLPREAFADVYTRAWELGLKGCTVFRPNTVRGAVLSGEPAGVHCCAPEREAD